MVNERTTCHCLQGVLRRQKMEGSGAPGGGGGRTSLPVLSAGHVQSSVGVPVARSHHMPRYAPENNRVQGLMLYRVGLSYAGSGQNCTESP